MAFVMHDAELSSQQLTLYLDRAGARPEQVFADAAQAVTAVLLTCWTEEQLEQVGIGMVPGPEPHEGRWSVTITFGIDLSDADYQRLAEVAVTALRARGYSSDLPLAGATP
jgi:hypothetical protein